MVLYELNWIELNHTKKSSNGCTYLNDVLIKIIYKNTYSVSPMDAPPHQPKLHASFRQHRMEMKMKIQICFSGNDFADKKVHYTKMDLFEIDHISNGRKIRIEQSLAIMCVHRNWCAFFLLLLVNFFICIASPQRECEGWSFSTLFHLVLSSNFY